MDRNSVMYKTVFVFFCVSISCAKINAQQKNDYNSMLDSAINLRYNQFTAATRNSDKNYFENLYRINEEDQSFNNLTSSKKFKSINIYYIHNRDVLRHGIYAWKVFTTLNKNHLLVTIISYFITYKSHNYNFANGGGSKTIFEYDCSEGGWKLISNENSGN